MQAHDHRLSNAVATGFVRQGPRSCVQSRMQIGPQSSLYGRRMQSIAGLLHLRSIAGATSRVRKGFRMWAAQSLMEFGEVRVDHLPVRPGARATLAGAFSPDGLTIAACHSDHTVTLYSTYTVGSAPRRLVRVCPGHFRTPWVVRFHPSGKCIISGGLDGLMLMNDVESGNVLGMCHLGEHQNLPGDRQHRVSAMEWLDGFDDGSLRILACCGTGVFLWSLTGPPRTLARVTADNPIGPERLDGSILCMRGIKGGKTLLSIERSGFVDTSVGRVAKFVLRSRSMERVQRVALRASSLPINGGGNDDMEVDEEDDGPIPEEWWVPNDNPVFARSEGGLALSHCGTFAAYCTREQVGGEARLCIVTVLDGEVSKPIASVGLSECPIDQRGLVAPGCAVMPVSLSFDESSEHVLLATQRMPPGESMVPPGAPEAGTGGLYVYRFRGCRHDTRREDSTRDGNEDGNIHPVLMDSEDSGVGEAALDGGQPQNATHGDSGRIWLVRSLSTPSLTINFALWELGPAGLIVLGTTTEEMLVLTFHPTGIMERSAEMSLEDAQSHWA